MEYDFINSDLNQAIIWPMEVLLKHLEVCIKMPDLKNEVDKRIETICNSLVKSPDDTKLKSTIGYLEAELK